MKSHKTIGQIRPVIGFCPDGELPLKKGDVILIPNGTSVRSMEDGDYVYEGRAKRVTIIRTLNGRVEDGEVFNPRIFWKGSTKTTTQCRTLVSADINHVIPYRLKSKKHPLAIEPKKIEIQPDEGVSMDCNLLNASQVGPAIPDSPLPHQGISFYLSRNTLAYGGSYALTAYPPRRNPYLDAIKLPTGEIADQHMLGSWQYHNQPGETNFFQELSDQKAERLTRTRPLPCGHCRNLTTGEEFSITEAEIAFPMQKTQPKVEV